jgi:cyclopropane-fatty-acyl-phospholipid synthase
MTKLEPQYDTVQSIYDHDHTTDWLKLFLDPTMLYSCAYFERPDMTLEEAQLAKLDLSLEKCDLKPGQTLLEVGCGWGACSYRAAEKFKVNVIGLTLSETQRDFCTTKMKGLPAGSGDVEIRLQGWEEFEQPVDRIVSIAAFEHFGRDRHAPFFARCRQLLPTGGRLMVHSIVAHDLDDLREKNLELTDEIIQFYKFLYREIFPGGFLRRPAKIAEIAEESGFDVILAQPLGPHYAQTLDGWAEALEQRKDEAIHMRSADAFDRYMKYLVGCADLFRSGHIDVYQFTCAAI